MRPPNLNATLLRQFLVLEPMVYLTSLSFTSGIFPVTSGISEQPELSHYIKQ